MLRGGNNSIDRRAHRLWIKTGKTSISWEDKLRRRQRKTRTEQDESNGRHAGWYEWECGR